MVSAAPAGFWCRQILRLKNHYQPHRLIPPSDRLIARSKDAHFNHEEIGRDLRHRYLYAPKDEVEKTLEMVQALIASMSKPQLHLHEFLQEVARTIYHHLHIREVTIGVRSAGDGLFRYEAMYGLRHEAWSAHKPLAYTEEDFFNPNKWKGTVISRQTRLLLAEDNPYEDKEEQTYDMQLSAKSKRRTPEHSIEGDYLDVLCYGPDDELMGWIETSGTWDGKIPDARTVRYLELIASVVATAVEMSEHRANKG